MKGNTLFINIKVLDKKNGFQVFEFKLREICFYAQLFILLYSTRSYTFEGLHLICFIEETIMICQSHSEMNKPLKLPKAA
ncbi:hypothetical protein SAMN05661044_04103 [Olivibacter domesticus]|uniref:Uncharacterized protein n=1 Tax=Olivibacter domesticus TaxID=407022 RepID=A0A1H7V572_OLID1|nr:hypothetical protein SAMN05661044_04103 [Olivibacter domesticus]